MEYTIIDAHSHLWLRQDTTWNGMPVKTTRNGRSFFLTEEVQMLPPFMVDGVNSAEVFLSNMDYARVGGAVVVQEFIDGIQNDYLESVKRKYPERFFVFGMCDYFKPGFSDEARSLADRGFKGIAIPGHRLLLDDGRVALNSPEMMRMFHMMEDYGMILSVCLAGNNAQTAEFKEVIQECPRLKIAIGHFGMVTAPGWEDQVKLALNDNVMIESGGITWLFNSEFYPFKGAVKAIREAYPEIRIVGSSGPNSEGEQFDYLWPEMARLGADLVDEHFYRPEKWFLAQGARYDNYDRKGPKVFAGEYACHGAGKKWNHFEAALLEAAFMTGLERNADIVHMATYAPLFAHVEGWQWRPDLIWFDNLRSMRSCSYYVQQLYTTYKGTNMLELKAEDGRNVTGADGQNGLFASSVLDADKGLIYVKVANVSDSAQQLRIDFDGLRRKEVMKGVGIVTYHSDDPDADNTLDEPEKIVPQTAALDFEGRSLSTEIGPKTFAVYVLEKR